MPSFRALLQREYQKRLSRNPSYSLRSFARHLELNHATLSSLLSGKRKITEKTIKKLAPLLSLSPQEVANFIESLSLEVTTSNFLLIEQDAFSAMSEWYYDAILELSTIPRFILEPQIIAKSLGISNVQARTALDTLQRLGLLIKDSNASYSLANRNTINILDTNFTSAANRKYQKSVIEKSLEALETIDRTQRDHTSTTLAINNSDLPRVKKLIQNFRHELNDFTQRKEIEPNEVYQLQVSFFPLTKSLGAKS